MAAAYCNDAVGGLVCWIFLLVSCSMAAFFLFVEDFVNQDFALKFIFDKMVLDVIHRGDVML